MLFCIFACPTIEVNHFCVVLLHCYIRFLVFAYAQRFNKFDLTTFSHELSSKVILSLLLKTVKKMLVNVTDKF